MKKTIGVDRIRTREKVIVVKWFYGDLFLKKLEGQVCE